MTTSVSVFETFSFRVLTSVSVQFVTSWKIGQPVQSQIRQTSADRTDFAY